MLIRTNKKFRAITVPGLILFALGIMSYTTAAKLATLTISHPSARQEPVQAAGTDAAAAPTGVECKLSNYSIRPIYYGQDFIVEKLVQNRWVPVPASVALRFELGIAFVWPLSSVKITYPTSLFTDQSGAGSYRIVQTVWTGKATTAVTAAAKKHALYATFIID